MSRTLALGEMLRRDFEVDVVGSAFGDGIWGPARRAPWTTTNVAGAHWPWYATSVRRLLRALTGDVVYALKPLPTSLGVALEARRRGVAPVVLDVEDDEFSFRPRAGISRPRSVASAALNPNSRLWTSLIHRRMAQVDAVTVATTGLQGVYGGSLIPHARDTDLLRPSPGARKRGRAMLGDPPEAVVMFAGTPRPFKGVADLAAAARRTRTAVRTVIAGAPPADPFVQQLLGDFPELHVLPAYEHDELVPLLEAADVVVVPQRRTPQTERQMPAKLLDAMAMARPIVATAVSDIPATLAGGRGVVVEPGDVAGLAAAIDGVLEDRPLSAEMGRRARDWCVAHASYDAVRPRLREIVSSTRTRWDAVRPR
jgi:glycosyltransferase involved in cell wall biosynthesis